MRKLSHEDFLERVYKLHSNITIIGVYTGSKSKIEAKCNIDGYEWLATPNQLLYGYGCKKCASNQLKITKDEFLKNAKLNEKQIELTSKYINTHTEASFKCLKCNHKWTLTRANTIIQEDTKCPRCSGKAPYTKEEFILKLNSLNENIELVGGFIDTQHKAKFKCKLDGCIWETKPNSIMNGTGCPICHFKNEKKTYKFIKEIFNIDAPKETININNKRLIVDFSFVFNNKKIFVEYNGEQHYHPVCFGNANYKEKFEEQKIRDEMLRIYCRDKNIQLLEIDGRLYKGDKIKKVIEDFKEALWNQ